jgi:uncharacterized protein (DUF2252 family)
MLPMMIPIDPLELARRQLASDREKTAAFRGLFERKLRRMSASPLAFLRGAAPLFYAILHDRPFLAEGPEGEGWLTGDMHLENFGAYRPDPHSYGASEEGDARATFDLNDFDDAIVGPLRFDVLRLTTSLILGGRELGADGVTTLQLCDRLLDAYTRTAFGSGRLPTRPGPVRKLVQQVRARTRKRLLEGRTLRTGKLRRFVRDDPDDRYRDLPRAVRNELPRAFARYVTTLARQERPADPSALEVEDGALRIAGTGSLGSLRVAVLVRGKGGRDGGWIFDLKEQGDPSASILLGKPLGDPATRVVTAVRACLAHPPRMLGTTTLGGRSMFVRRLAPQEDKLELTRTNSHGDVEHAIHHEDLGPLAEYLGALLGRAHRRGARRPLGKAWSHAARKGIVLRAITIAGLHEAVYLSICKLEHAYLARR